MSFRRPKAAAGAGPHPDRAPDILLLDEATAALDMDAVADFHLTLRECLPQTAVLAVLHGDAAPCDPGRRALLCRDPRHP